MRSLCYASLDDALETLAPYGTELKNGNSNHGPMVAEALCALGRPDAVMPWIARYRERMLRRSGAQARIRREDWRAALGERARFADWSRFFGEELQEAPWREVLDRWMERFAPREAIARIPIVPPDLRVYAGNITASLAMLDDLPEFAEAIGLIDTRRDLPPLLAELTEVFARVYLANAHDIRSTIAFIHGVTSPAALGNIAPLVSDRTARATVRYAWQAGCGLYACFGGETVMALNVEPREADADGLVERAIAHGDEHVIKFTEACLHRHTLDPSPVYFAAVDHARRMIPTR